MKTEFHPASDRGHADHGWLDSYHSFSFGTYFNPLREKFGCLRVLNDDLVAPATGFDLHPHNNMEIVSIVTEGTLEHRDSMGNVQLLEAGEVQVLSAGTGIFHAEYNHSETDAVKFFQLWIFPREKHLKPRYDQKSFTGKYPENGFVTLVTPDRQQQQDALWIHQDAFVSKALLTAGSRLTYEVKTEGNGVFVMVTEGETVVEGHTLKRRDALAVSETQKIEIAAAEKSLVLVIEVPMQ